MATAAAQSSPNYDRRDYLQALYAELEAYKSPSLFKSVILKMRDTGASEQEIGETINLLWTKLPDGSVSIGPESEKFFGMKVAWERLDAFLEKHFLDAEIAGSRRWFFGAAIGGTAGFVIGSVAALTQEERSITQACMNVLGGTVVGALIGDVALRGAEIRDLEKAAHKIKSSSLPKPEQEAKKLILRAPSYDSVLAKRLTSLRETTKTHAM